MTLEVKNINSTIFSSNLTNDLSIAIAIGTSIAVEPGDYSAWTRSATGGNAEDEILAGKLICIFDSVEKTQTESLLILRAFHGQIPSDALATPENVVWVSKNGSNTTGEGTFYKPYLTIKFANDSITDNTSTKRYAVSVFPGVYTEDPIVMKEYVDIIAYSDNITTKIVASAASNTMFTNNVGNNKLKKFSLEGASSGTAYSVTSAITATIEGCTFIGCQTGVNVSNGYVVARECLAVPSASTIVTMFNFTASGTGLIQNFLNIQATVTTLIKASGANVVVNFSDISNSGSGLNTLLDVSDSAFVQGIQVRSTKVSYGVRAATSSQTVLSNIGIYSLDTGVPFGVGVEVNNASVIISSSELTCATALDVSNSALAECRSCDFQASTVNVSVADTSSKVFFAGGELKRERVIFPALAGGVGYFIDRKVGDEGLIVFGELAVGRPDRGFESVFGEGDSYTEGMNVITSDNTATSTTDGGNLTDVSEDAREIDSIYFGFQGVTANHCIYISSDIQNLSFTTTLDYARLTGIKVQQNIAAVEVTAKSFVFEYWNGSAWTEFPVLATESNQFYRYANEVFIRPSSSEQIRFGFQPTELPSKKTVFGKERYWIRIRIATTVTTAPTFEQFKIGNNKTEINQDGTVTFHGLSRFVKALSFQSNTFGESGGVTHSRFSVGTGVIPNAWTHIMKNNRLNVPGDAVYATSLVPEGTCTSCGIRIKVTYLALQAGASTNGSMIISFLPVETAGALEANQAGGITSVNRTLLNTKTIISDSAQVSTVSLDLSSNTQVVTVKSDLFDIADFYEDDILFIRVEYDNNGDAKKDIAILGLEIEGVQWTLGARV